MVVLSIMGFMLAIVIPKISNRNRELKSTLRRFTVLSKDLHRRAKLSNATYRIAIDLNNGQNVEGSKQSYWVEKSSSPGPFKKPKDLQELRKALEDEQSKEDAGKIISPGDFEIDHKLFKQAQELPGGLLFSSVELASAKGEVFESGVVYIHYAPQGLVEESAIHLKIEGENEIHWTISIHPLTGKAELTSKNISLKEIMDQ